MAEDERGDIGPIEGLITALGAAREDYVIVAPCDTPFLRADLCEAIASFAKGRDGAVPVVRSYLEPLHSAYRRRRCLAAFEEALEEGERKLGDIYRRLDMLRIDEEELRVLDPHLESFWNINTPEDLALAERRITARDRK